VRIERKERRGLLERENNYIPLKEEGREE